MILLYLSSLSVTTLHLWHLPDPNHDHVGWNLQWGRHQQPGWLHWGANGSWRGAGRYAWSSWETWTHGGPSVSKQWVYHHQEEEEPACPQHNAEYTCHWQILPNDFPWFIHLLQPYLLVSLLLKGTRVITTETVWMLHHNWTFLDIK